VSFILDALRKSDRRRRMNEAPGLSSSVIESQRSGPERSGGLRLVLIVTLMLALVLVVLAFVLRDRIENSWNAWVGVENPAGSPEAVPEVAEAIVPPEGAPEEARSDPALAAYRERIETPRERLVSDPEAARQEIERLVAAQSAASSSQEEGGSANPGTAASNDSREGQKVSRPAPERNRPSPASAEQIAEIERRLAEAQRRRELAEAADGTGEAVPGADGSEETGDGERTDDWSPVAAEYVHAWELPLSIRRSLPDLNLNIHVFSEQLEERFVLINGERYISGDELPDGARLVDIRREGAVVDYRDYRFLLEP
jgi:hypothetical protein